MIRQLRSVALFAKWSRSALKLLHGFSKEIKVTRGINVIHEGEVCTMFFIIMEGEFQLRKRVKKPLHNKTQEDTFLSQEFDRKRKPVSVQAKMRSLAQANP